MLYRYGCTVKNNTKETIIPSNANLTVLNNDDTVAGTFIATVFPSVIKPGETGYFSVWNVLENSSPDTYKETTVSIDYGSSNFRNSQPVSIEKINFVPPTSNYDAFKVTALVTNPHDSKMTLINVAAICYDGDGNIVNISEGFTSVNITAHGNSGIKINAYMPRTITGTIKKVECIGQGDVDK